MLHLIDNPVLEKAPDDIPYCRGLLEWQGDMLAVIDCAAFLNQTPTQDKKTKLIGIFAYLDSAVSTPRFGALAIDNIPVRRMINDNQACALPSELSAWAAYSIACFSDEGHAIPVLNLDTLFAETQLANHAASLHNVIAGEGDDLQSRTDETNEAASNSMDITSLMSPNLNSCNTI